MRQSRREGLVQAWRDKYEGSVAQDLAQALSSVDFGSRIVLFGAAMLLSVLPMILLLSAFSSHRADSDIAQHLGLNKQGSRIVEGLF